MSTIPLKDGDDVTFKGVVSNFSKDGKRVCLTKVVGKRKGHHKNKHLGKEHYWVPTPKGVKLKEGDKLVGSAKKGSYGSGKIGLLDVRYHDGVGALRRNAATGRGRGGGRRRRRSR